MTTTDRSDIITVLQHHHDMLGVDKKRVKELINSVAAIQTTDRKKTPVARAISAVEDVTGVTIAQIQSRNSKAPVRDARQIMAYILRNSCGLTLKVVGQYISRDHASVIWSVRVVDKRPEVFSARIKEIQIRLNQTR